MPSDQAIRQSGQPASIRTPDQLQQAKRPDAPRPGGSADRPREPDAAQPRPEGILGQLETERAHD
ncbi:hypothetical protein [Lichenibacterium dinghuense]|uniref:hypothetical protein n=1 Tax=Lichenibacterium dinghuense TaxID=2895977 RepID=UPI001F1E2696|nr:hypothetical protein [Lichenibacterium sp. 6Y81]